MRSLLLTTCLLALFMLVPALASAQQGVDGNNLSVRDAYAMELLASLRSAYRGIERERGTGDELALKIQFDLAIQCLTSLEQLFGFDWAAVRLRQLYRDPDCPDLHMGFSADRRVMLRIEPLELKNPVFDDYTIYLCTLESLNEADIHAGRRSQMLLQLQSGAELEADVVDKDHPLWPQLGGQAEGFLPPEFLASGHNVVFKQLYSFPALSREAVNSVSLHWDDYSFRLEWLENEVDID